MAQNDNKTFVYLVNVSISFTISKAFSLHFDQKGKISQKHTQEEGT